MNQITFEDFGLFRDELLQVDFISFNLSKLSESQILKLANYFQSLGFNCYQRKAETSQSRQEVYANYKYYRNPFELEFILNLPYKKDLMQIQFPELSANQFYKLIKQKYIPWEKLTKFEIVLSRFDLVYERINKSTDKIATKKFINSSYTQFQEVPPYRNLLSERN